jgi:hypothetical protein
MQAIHKDDVQQRIGLLKDEELYLHLEMTSGAYTAYYDSSKHPAATFVTNAKIRFSEGSIIGDGPYRIGLKTSEGWVYSEGLTHWDAGEAERLILSGHDGEGKLVVALQLSRTPF